MSTMQYVEVWVASQRYQKREPLTYATEVKLAPGTVVSVPMGRSIVLGYVEKNVSKPSFKTKPVKEVFELTISKESQQLFKWLLEYYPSGSGPVAQLFLPSTLLQTTRKQAEAAKKSATPPKLPTLTDEQSAALKQLQKSPRAVLHGETGSGKTRVYIERTRETLESGRSALILTPEIALTPQLEMVFKEQFGDKVFILHSNLKATVRRELWRRIITSSEPLVVIGPRSALFSPFKDLGLIVVDEFHEPAYKQEQAPRYQALRVAATLSQLHKASIIYGSATPPISEYYLAEATKTPIIRLSTLAKGKVQPVDIEVVPLKEIENFSRHRFISDTLLQQITKALSNKEQALIYLNRRGTARLVMCQTCGWQALCPRCDLPLTYHGDNHQMRCHTCGYKSTPPLSCPVCNSTDLQYRSIGTKAVVEALQGFFPNARIMRFDTDLGVNERIDVHFEDIKAGKVDILVGTQMLGKGLDLPKLSVVGVLSADTSLAMPDFSASERGYQLLHQVMGRVGRGHELKNGKAVVVLQTYMPDSAIIQTAIKKDWLSFYKNELVERKTFTFPPFCYLLKISASRKTSVSAEKAIRALHEKLQSTKLKVRLSDPAPSFYERSYGSYNWQLVLKATDRKELIKALESLPAGNWTYDLDPANLL